MLKYKKLWDNCVFAVCPSKTGPTGNKLYDFCRSNHGTLTNMDPATCWVRSGGKYCLNFDGGNDKITLGLSFSQILHGASKISFAAWIFPTAIDTGNYDNVICTFKSHIHNASMLWINIRGDGANANKLLVAGRSSYPADSFQETTSTATIPNNTWTHIVGILDYASGKINIYINGVLDTSTSKTFNSSTFVYTATPIFQSSLSADTVSTYPYQGRMDDILLYRKALTQSEITLLAKKRGIAYERKFNYAEMNDRLYIPPDPTSSTGIVQDFSSEKYEYPNVWKNCIYAACPSITGPTGLKLYDFAKNNVGTLTNMDAATDWPMSYGKHALDFDGSNDRCMITPLSRNKKQYSISMWVYPKNIPAHPNTPQLYVEHTTSYDYGRVGVSIINTSSVYYPACSYRDAPNDPAGTSIGLTSTIPVSLNTWSHVCVVFAPNYQAIYVNGKLGNSATNVFAGFADTTSANALFGQGYYATGNWNLYNGQLDDMRIYDRALTAGEIALLATERGIAYKTKNSIYLDNLNDESSFGYYRRLLLGVG